MIGKILVSVNVALAMTSGYIVVTVNKSVVKPAEVLIPTFPESSYSEKLILASAPSFDYYKVIVDARLFGIPLPPEMRQAKEKVNVPKPPLRIKLKGTTVGAYSIAVIEDESGKQDVYQLGDKASGAEIVGINRNHIVVRRDDTEERIYLSEEDKEIGKLGDLAMESPSPPPAIQVPVEVGPPPPGENITVKRAEINGKIQQAAEVAARNVKPFFRDGRVEGFQLSNIEKGNMLEQYGLKNGDIIRSVNGQPLDSIQRAYELAQLLWFGGASKVQIEVERQGKIQSLSYEVR